MQQILARLTGRSTDLLSYDEVREKLRARGGSSKGLQDIPLDAIVGSVGRYTDFTRNFLPKSTVDARRWLGVGGAVASNLGVPPIDVYKIGDVYFVLDGNHRVSIAREMGNTHIEAYVTEVYTKVPFSLNDSPDDLILKERYTEFLDETKLDSLHPDADLTTTAPGQYRKLLEHIDVHRYFMGLDLKRDVSYAEAVSHWYSSIYMPVIEKIRYQDVLRDFPGRTETDLYIWVMEHQDSLAQELGWYVEPEQALADLAEKAGSSPGKILSRVRHRVAHSVGADPVAPVIGSGAWRQEAFGDEPESNFARDILAPVNGQPDGWYGLDMAIQFAHRDGGRIHGLYVVSQLDDVESDEALAVKAEFDERCRYANVDGSLKIEHGTINNRISERSRWVDLVVPQLFHPPGKGTRELLSSGFRSLILRSPVPILAVPSEPSEIRTILLAYDGSPKAREALFIGAYLTNRWNVNMVVNTVHEQSQNAELILDGAHDYLTSVNISPTYVPIKSGTVGEGILTAAEDASADLIIMGGYGHLGFVQAVLGSSLDHVLRETKRPVLICR